MARNLNNHHLPAERINLAGVELLPSAVSDLALRLHMKGHTALSDYLGHGVDMTRDQIPLREADYAPILAVLIADCPPKLEPLRDHLKAVENQRTISSPGQENAASTGSDWPGPIDEPPPALA